MKSFDKRVSKIEDRASPTEWVILLPGDPDPCPDFVADYKIHIPPRFSRENGLVDPGKHPLVKP